MSDEAIKTEYGIDKVDPEGRSFGFWDTTLTWFGSGVNTGSWYFGGMAAALGFGFVLQYSLLWLPLLMIPWAAVAYIGYRHGANTVAVTRSSLGILGSRLSGLAEFVVCIGWPSVNTYIAAIAMSYVFSTMFGWPHEGQAGAIWVLSVSIFITATIQGIIMVMGHEAIRYLERIAVVLLILLGGWESYIVLTHWDFSKILSFSAAPDMKHSPAFYIDLAFGFCWTWAQVADFSRFSKTGSTATVGSWLGINLGQGWFMLIGALGVIGVALQTGTYSPENSDPSTVLAELGLGTVSFLVIIAATISTNVSILYGSGMGLVGTFRSRHPRQILVLVALVQLVLCFSPLLFTSFTTYFETFLTVIGGMFLPLWTVVVLDYYLLRRMRIKDQDIFANDQPGEKQASTFDFWNIRGFTAIALGLLVFYVLTYGLEDIARYTTASFPAIIVSALAYIVLFYLYPPVRR